MCVLEYSRMDIFALLELMLTFCLHVAYFRLVNLFRLQSFILLNVCRNYFSFKLGDSKIEIIFALCAMGFHCGFESNFFFYPCFLAFCRISGVFR